MPEPMGGNAAGSNPGWLLRAGMASCAATVIAMRAAMQESRLRRSRSRSKATPTPVASSASPMLRRHSEICVCQADGVDAAQLRELAAWGEAHSPVSCTLRARPSVAFDVAVD